MALQISGNDITVPRDTTVTRNLTVGGVLTYEDVTNVDSIGIVTARAGVLVGSGITLSKDGDIFATGISTFSEGIAGDLLIDDKIVHRGDTNTAIRFPAADTISFENGGSETARFSSTNQFSVGTTADVTGASVSIGASMRLVNATGSTATISALPSGSYNTGVSGGSAIAFHRISDGGGASDEIAFETHFQGNSHAERLRINKKGQLLVGHTASVPIDVGHEFKVQVSGTDFPTSGVSQQRFQDSSSGATLALCHSRNGTQGSHTILQSNDEYGKIRFYGSDGTDFDGYGVGIVAKVDGGIGVNSTPGRFEVHTTPAGGVDAIERFRIDSNGHVTKPYQFHIEVDRDSDQTGYNAAANFGTPMIFNRVIQTRGTANSALDTSDGKITVPVAGVYYLEASIVSSGNVLQQAWFTEGASRMSYSDWTEDELTNRVQVSGMHYLAANTEVGVKPYGAGQTNITILDSIYHTWFRVTLIG